MNSGMAEVLQAPPSDGQFQSKSPLKRSSTSQTSLYATGRSYNSGRNSQQAAAEAELRHDSILSSDQSSPHDFRLDDSQSSSYFSTPASTISLATSFEDDESEDEDEGISFPSYHQAKPIRTYEKEVDRPASPTDRTTLSPPSSCCPEDTHPVAEDDTAVRREPSQHVDYLSHEWHEEDIWASWRHIVSKRKVYGERSRLENASWRTWAKSQNKLATVSPEKLNWLKDCDVTWLYGPLQTSSRRLSSNQISEPATTQLSKNNSFLHKKPILKKRSVSEVMLQRSISASSLVKQAAASVQAQQSSGHTRRVRPSVTRAVSDFATASTSSRSTSQDTTDCFSSRSTSGLHTPDHGEKKHIRFDDNVEQCIAVEIKDGEYDEEEENWASRQNDDSSDDEGVVMMKASTKKKPLSRSNSRSSFSGESKTIAKLPSTTLKYRTDSPDVTEQTPQHSLGFYRSSKLSPSPSQETLRPAHPSSNFLIGEDDDEDDEFNWDPSRAFGGGINSAGVSESRARTDEAVATRDISGLRRTESGMFMPYEDEEAESPNGGILGRVVDTVNTARDIAHVIWNVGWRN